MMRHERSGTCETNRAFVARVLPHGSKQARQADRASAGAHQRLSADSRVIMHPALDRMQLVLDRISVTPAG
ncbi:hypothetical protein BS78_01G402400 [Paspalum vaginatum]|nr:hypothetical protein BS78_01G402400 [Paspalum vaginatum]